MKTYFRLGFAHFVLAVCLLCAAGMQAYAANQVVLVENTDVGRLHYPVYITNGQGYRVRCLSQSDEDAVLRGLGVLAPPSEVLDPFADVIVSADPASRPYLCPASDQYPIKLFVHNGGEGDRYYLQFPTDFGATSHALSLFVPGCIGLLDALQVDVSTAINADPTPFFGDNIHNIECISGSPISVAPSTFTEWCAKSDLSDEQRATVRAVLALTPQGEPALGDPLRCQDANAFLNGIPSLNLLNSDIHDVSPLGTLVNLTSLTLSGNRIEDVSPLFSLSNLTVLDVSDNALDNIAAVGAFTGLKELKLANNQITDLRPLSALVTLEKLNLSGNRISDVMPIANILTLQQVRLAHNQLRGDAIEALTGLGALTLLDLSHNQIESVDHLSQLPSNVEVHLDGNPVMGGHAVSFEQFCVLHQNDATPLGFTVRKLMESTGNLNCRDAANQLESQASLTLAGMGISDIGPLTLLENLRSLDLSGNSVVEVTGIEALKQLTSLNLANNSIRNITHVGQLVNLSQLDLSGNPVEVGDYLSACLMREHADVLTEDQSIEVEALYEAAGATTCLESQTRLNRLTVLNLSAKRLRSLDYFPVLDGVQTLILNDNELVDVARLNALPALRSLHLPNNSITSIQSLRSLNRLTRLGLYGNPISSIVGIRDLRSLQYVDLRRTGVRTIKELKHLNELQTANVSGLNLIYGDFETYCLVYKYDRSSLAHHRNYMNAVMPLIRSANVDTADCEAVDEWARTVTKLNLNKKNLTRIDPVKQFVSLKELYLHDNRISDVGPIVGLAQLETLNLSKNRIINFPRINSRNLKKLYLMENSITNVWDISFVDSLTTLRLDNNRVSDPRPLTRLSRLTYLDIRSNQIASFPFATAILVKNPYLKGNPVCNITHMPVNVRTACTKEPPLFPVVVNPNLVVNPIRVIPGILNNP